MCFSAITHMSLLSGSSRRGARVDEGLLEETDRFLQLPPRHLTSKGFAPPSIIGEGIFLQMSDQPGLRLLEPFAAFVALARRLQSSLPFPQLCSSLPNVQTPDPEGLEFGIRAFFMIEVQHSIKWRLRGLYKICYS